MTDIGVVLIIILVVVLVARGPKTLPQLGEAFGKAVTGARKAAREGRQGETHGPDDGAGH
jgi:Sec-independent protein translocase protein TatA